MIDTTLLEKYVSLWPKRDVATMSDAEFSEELESALRENAKLRTGDED